ncbi:MAG: HAMP domain-containing protein, partial [Candidatus Rokubacteria bacterium]|nr:HAMP domain-containing protein [Candidatus Rokubacteria bacterium]
MIGFRWTIKRKLLALGAATLLPLLLLLVYWAWWEVAEHTKGVEAELTLTSEQAASQVDLLLGSVTGHLRALAQNQAVQRRQISRIEELLRQVRAQHSELEGIIAVSADGRTFASVPEPPAAQISFADRPWFKQVMAIGQPVVGDFLIGRIRGQPVAVVAVPLREGDGPPTGALAAGVSLRRLHLLFQSLPLIKERSVTVLDGEGKVLSQAPKAEGWIGRRLPSAAALPAGAGLVKNLQWFEGGERVVAVSPVAGTGWRVLAGVPQGSLQARVWSEVLAIGLPLFGLLAVSSLIGLLIGRRVWRPLRALADAAKKLPEGELRAIRVSTTDEVGELARAFNAMGELVTETKAKLERRVSELAALFETGQLFSQTLDLPTVLTRLADLAQSRLGVDVARIWLYDETHQTLVPGADAGLLRGDARFRRRPAEGLSG